MVAALISSLAIAVVMTLGDFVWAAPHLSHRMWYGLAHGALLCMAMGLTMGVPARRPITGAVGGIVAGLLAAASFYLLAPLMRYSAMFAAWFLLWVLIACLDGPILRRTGAAAALVRGLAAAVASGLAFYAVSGMWTHWNPDTINYLDHYVRWVVAFLPGFLALKLETR